MNEKECAAVSAPAVPEQFDMGRVRNELVQLVELNHRGKNTSPTHLREFIAWNLMRVPAKEVQDFIAMVNQCVPESLFQRMFWMDVAATMKEDDKVTTEERLKGGAASCETIREEIGVAFRNGITSWEAKSGMSMG